MTDYIITELPYSDSFLEHYGIPGQKWGVRRFQYEDRTWTPEGKIRYGRGGGERRSNDSEGVKGVRDSVKAAIKSASSKIERKISGSDDHQITRKKAKDMSDEELRTAMMRLNAEKAYRDLYDTVHKNDQTPSKIVKSVLRPIANVAGYAGDRFTKGAIDKLLEVTLNADAYNTAREMREINLQNARLNQEKLEDELARARVQAAQRLTREEATKLKEEEQQTARLQREMNNEVNKLRRKQAELSSAYLEMPETTPEEKQAKEKAYEILKAYTIAANDAITIGQGKYKQPANSSNGAAANGSQEISDMREQIRALQEQIEELRESV